MLEYLFPSRGQQAHSPQDDLTHFARQKIKLNPIRTRNQAAYTFWHSFSLPPTP